MTENIGQSTDKAEGAAAKKDCGCGCGGSGGCGGSSTPVTAGSSRRLILGGIPVALTLASRPALADDIVCTPSVIASLNPSHGVQPLQNCAVSPGCWKQLAASDKLWQSTASLNNGNGGAAYALGQSFSATFGLPSNNWGVTGTDTLFGALNGACHVTYTHGSDVIDVSGQGFEANLVAALLNACAFGPSGHFPLASDGITIINLVKTIWVPVPNPVNQGSVSDAATKSSAFQSISSSQNTSVDQCRQDL